MISKEELDMQMTIEMNRLRGDTYEKMCEIAIKYGKRKAIDALYAHLIDGLEEEHNFVCGTTN